jgi:hypothetical protein
VIFEGQASPEIIDSLTKRLEALSVPQKSAAFQVYASLTQGVWETFSMMRQVCANDLWNVVLETLYAALPGAMILSLAVRNLRRSVEEKSWLLRSSKYALFLASGLGPVFILALAFDTSRLASFSTLTALLTIGLLPSRQEHTDQESVRFMSAYILAIVAYLAFPILDLHPWNAQALNIRRVSVICSPCAAMGVGFGDYINRRRTPEERASFDSNVDYGN